MSADQLTQVESMASAVLDVLAGADPRAVAQRHRIPASALADAVDAFTTAGLAALHQPASAAWFQAGIAFADDHRSKSAAAAVAVALDETEAEGAHAGWWFLRKPPGWRVRLLGADLHAVTNAMDELRAAGHIRAWSRGTYEPETVAFGGAAAMAVVHELFCADSRSVLRHALSGDTAIGPREMSVALLGALTRNAGLDQFETGDVFGKVAALRPPLPPDQAGRVLHLAEQIHPLITNPVDERCADWGTTIPHARAWLGAFSTAGTRLAQLATSGSLSRGIRAIVAQIVIFHWNRIGLPASSQSILAAAAVQALLPADRPVR